MFWFWFVCSVVSFSDKIVFSLITCDLHKQRSNVLLVIKMRHARKCHFYLGFYLTKSFQSWDCVVTQGGRRLLTTPRTSHTGMVFCVSDCWWARVGSSRHPTDFCWWFITGLRPWHVTWVLSVASLPWHSVLSLISFSKVYSTVHMLVTTSIIMQQSILPIRPSVLVLKWISELAFKPATHILSRQHAYLASKLTKTKEWWGAGWKSSIFLITLSDIKTLPTDTKLKVACTEEHDGLFKRCTQTQRSGTKVKRNVRKPTYLN